MLKIALTGGIGSGKSTVASYFATLNIPVIESDKIVAELLAPNTPTYKKIVAHLGNAYLTPKMTLARTKLRNLIWFNEEARLWLEALLHPQVATRMLSQVTTFSAPYTIMEIPLFFETKFPPPVDRVLVVDCPETTQIARLRHRPTYTHAAINQVIALQIKRLERLKLADDIIDNSGGLPLLRQKVIALDNYYRNLAAAPTTNVKQTSAKEH